MTQLLKISGVEEFATSATLTLGSTISQDKAVLTFNHLVPLPTGPVDLIIVIGDEETTAGMWELLVENKNEQGSEVWRHTLQMGRASQPEATAEKLSDPDYLKSEIARLIKPENKLYEWNRLLLFLPGNPNSPEAAGPDLDAGTWLAEMIIADLPAEVQDFNAVLKVLSEYQLVTAPGGDPTKLAFMLDDTNIVELPDTLRNWRSANNHGIKEDQQIVCDYINSLGTIQQYKEGSSSNPLYVEKPANSIIEATLETKLQREILFANKWRATALMDLAPAWQPLTTIARDDRMWRVLTVNHRWPGGTTAPTTELQVRGLMSPTESAETGVFPNE